MAALAAIIRAANRQNKSLDLSRKDLDQCPSLIEQLTKIEEIKFTNNRLTDIPKGLCLLNRISLLLDLSAYHQKQMFFSGLLFEMPKLAPRLHLLNIAGNQFTVLPINLQYLTNLRSLIAYNNRIEILPPIVLNGLKNVTLLNLNNNNLKCIPSEIGRLENLQSFSVEHNHLEELPFELCYLEQLENLYLGYNRLVSLPEELGRLWKLKQLILHKNCLQELPGSITNCGNLTVLDVASNALRTFPPEFETLPLKKFYYECNPLLQLIPISSVQEEEVFSLKEIVARYIMNQMKNNYSSLWENVITNPDTRTILNEGGQCAVCGDFLLNTWLECVKFVQIQKDPNTKSVWKVPSHFEYLENQLHSLDATLQSIHEQTLSYRVAQYSSSFNILSNNHIHDDHGFKASSDTNLMPINARLCSYKCFNKKHNFYGIAHSTESL